MLTSLASAGLDLRLARHSAPFSAIFWRCSVTFGCFEPRLLRPVS